MSLGELHDLNAWLLIALNAAAGVWCVAAYRVALLAGRPMWVFVGVAQASAFTQAVIGALWANQTGVELDDMHALYGFSAIVAVMIMYAYRTSPFLQGKELLLYGGGSWFVMGLGLRNLVL